ncbi:hypothetical protein CHI14_20610 [Paenibacillus sp. 7516]|nr:hypothetical protein CHI14_20610 [Paenibacillus sp. 7516]
MTSCIITIVTKFVAWNSWFWKTLPKNKTEKILYMYFFAHMDVCDLVLIPHVVGTQIWNKRINGYIPSAKLDKKIGFVTMFTISSQV